MKNILILFQNNTEHAKAQLDILHAAYAFEIPVKLAFCQSGVLLLKPTVEPSFTAFFKELSIYDIDTCYVEQESLTQYQLTPNDLMCAVTVISQEELYRLKGAAHWVVN